ncbi:hypothetical protein ACHAPU_010265 [Fusarium lateritium]
MSSNMTVEEAHDRFQLSLPVMNEHAYDYDVKSGEPLPHEVYSDLLIVLRHPTCENARKEDFKLRRLLRMIYGSNKISEIKGSFKDVRDICMPVFYHEGKIPVPPHGPTLDEIQTFRHAEASAWMLAEMRRGEGLTEEMILQAHAMMTFEIYADDQVSGKYRQHEMHPDEHFAHAKNIPGRMKKLIENYYEDISLSHQQGTPDCIALASWVAQDFIRIRPFTDGNGRMSRLIINAIIFKFLNFVLPIGENAKSKNKFRAVAHSVNELHNYEHAIKISSFVLGEVFEAAQEDRGVWGFTEVNEEGKVDEEVDEEME